MYGANSGELRRVAAEFRSVADEIDGESRLLTQMLRSVEWVGRVASGFSSQWAGVQLPRMGLSTSFLRDAAVKLERNADEQDQASSAVGGTAAGGRPAPKPGTNGMAKDVFSEDYMRNVPKGEFPTGTGDPRLNDALERLLDETDPAKIDALLAELARLRDVPLDQLRADYARYLDLKAQVDASGGADQIDLTKSPDFMGSRWSMRFGQYVGDALGIDPVFGALLSPTGGLVGGKDDWAGWRQQVAPTAIKEHAAAHDAAGFLYNKLDVGPGYIYRPGILPENSKYPTSHHVGGQASGVAWWAAHRHGNDILRTVLVPPPLRLPSAAVTAWRMWR